MATGFPLIPLGIKVELLVNGAWTDISRFVYQRDDITITGGAPDETSSAQPAQIKLTLNNRDNRFTPGNTSGAYYPYLTRNMQLRLSISTQSVTGNAYSGYRFWGSVQDWPPSNDTSGNDVFVQITASGPLRQLQQNGNVGSALVRYYNSLTGQYAPIAYWPCEEDPQSTILGAGIDGGTNMNVTSGTPKWKSVSSFNGSAPMPIVNRSVWDGLTGSYGASGDDIYSTPGTYKWIASTTTVDARVWAGGGGGAGGGFDSNGYNCGGGGGGGGEYAEETALAVTPGNQYTIVVGAGGQGGPPDNGGTVSDGTNGGDSTFAGDSVIVHANGGIRGHGGNFTPQPFAGGLGGSTSTNSIHHFGGTGGSGINVYEQYTPGSPGNNHFGNGGGGGGSGGTGVAGNNGTTAPSGGGGAGAVAVSGGGAGGAGGNSVNGGHAGFIPGGGGGGGGSDNPGSLPGGAGSSGKVELIYTPPPAPPANVMRFILLVPPHGGNNNAELIRFWTGGAVHYVTVNYISGGKLLLQGWSSLGVLLFSSGNVAFDCDGKNIMVSIELTPSGTSLNWYFAAISPSGNNVINHASGTILSSAIGNVTECTVDQGANVTTTAIGHISVQYAVIPLVQVATALDGHTSELSVDRFIRLCNEEALSAFPTYLEGGNHWGFESGSMSFTAANGAVTQSAVTASGWPADGTAHSLRLTANGSGQPSGTSPIGTSGQPCRPGDVLHMAADLYAPAALSHVYIGLKFYNSAGTFLSEADLSDQAPMTSVFTLNFSNVTVPSTAQYFAVTFGDHNTDSNGTLLYIDNIRISAAMNAHTRDAVHKLMKQIEALDKGILCEARTGWGLGYKTLLSLINQTAQVTFDYSLAHLAAVPQPVFDDRLTHNDITVKRYKGSTVRVTSSNGNMSIQEPPNGVRRKSKKITAVALADTQILILANWLLNLGTVTNERYPTITVDMTRTAVANIFASIANADIGNYIKIINLPAWFPSSSTDQYITGYTETINAFKWTITWNCAPYSPYMMSASSIPRWL